jgi:hypothetical protein
MYKGTFVIRKIAERTIIGEGETRKAACEDAFEAMTLIPNTSFKWRYEGYEKEKAKK